MQLEHTFSVPLGIDAAWRLLLDVERIAGCVPGATIEAVNGDEITGAIKIKLGAIGPTYKGSATITTKDADGHRAVLTAHADTRTNGSATAKVTATLSEFGGATSVMIVTDLELTGKPAQLEQSVISEAGDRLARQFAQRLSDLIAVEAALAPAPPSIEESQVSPTDMPAEVPDHQPDTTPGEPEAAFEAIPGDPDPDAPQPRAEAAPVPPPVRPRPSPRPRPAPSEDASPARAVRAVASAPRHADVAPARGENAADGPAIPPAKKYAPVAALAVLLLIRRRRRRKRRRASA